MTRRDPSLKPGALFQNQFEIRGLLGSGGHAFVYRALDQIMGREVALKLIEIPASAARDRRRRARLEAQVLSKLNHRNIVRVFGAGATDDDWIYLVMEVLEGRSLRDAMQEHRRLRLVETLLIGAQIADGVHAAHQASTIHRDLKPENVFLERGNQVRVIDFGVAKFAEPDAQTTQRDLIHGTIYYMSPEHLQGLAVTARSDVFALGVTLYEMLAGIRPALVGLQEVNPNAVVYQQIHRMPPALDELRPDIPPFVARTIQRMIAKDPVDRIQSMTEVASILRANLARCSAEAGHLASKARDLSRPGLSAPVELKAQPATGLPKQARRAVAAVTQRLTSPPDVPAATLPTRPIPGATIGDSALRSSPPASAATAWWSVSRAAQRPLLQRVLGTGLALGTVLGVAAALTGPASRPNAAGLAQAPPQIGQVAPIIPSATRGLVAMSIASAIVDASPAKPEPAGAAAAPRSGASKKGSIQTRTNEAGLPGSGLDESSAARHPVRAQVRPKETARPTLLASPEDIR